MSEELAPFNNLLNMISRTFYGFVPEKKLMKALGSYKCLIKLLNPPSIPWIAFRACSVREIEIYRVLQLNSNYDMKMGESLQN